MHGVLFRHAQNNESRIVVLWLCLMVHGPIWIPGVVQ